MRALIHVQHLLGVGHLQRAAEIAGALRRAGFKVTLASGGMTAPRALDPAIEFCQLPPLYSPDGSFSALLDENGLPIDDNWRAHRSEYLLQLYRRVRPRVLITEGFPFARRMLRFELLPLLEIARQDRRCRLIVSSVRDILQPKSRPERNTEILQWLERYYDRVLVHGDRNFARLDYSFAPAATIEDRIAYTGYIATSVGNAGAVGSSDEVIVSAGGSDTGLKLLQTAIASRPLCALAGKAWRILVSHAIDDEAFDGLRAMAGAGIIVERNRRDFPELLASARLSISQAGYNTMTDLLRTRTPAVLVPFAEAGEREQSLRAELLHQRHRAILVNQDELSPARLASAIDQALAYTSPLELSLDGAQRSAELIRQWLATYGDAA